MQLETSYGTSHSDPGDAEFREALAHLNLQRDGEGFAIYSRDQMSYVQVGGDQHSGFEMEYQEGSTDQHFRAQRTDFSLDEVLRAMSEYRAGTIQWADYGPWERISW